MNDFGSEYRRENEFMPIPGGANGATNSNNNSRKPENNASSNKDDQKKDEAISYLAAYHGHLPLLQELLRSLKTLDPSITGAAGESSSSQSPLLRCFGF